MDWSGQPAWSTSVVNDWGRDCIEQTTLYRTLRRRGQPAWSTIGAEIVLSRLPCTVRSPGMVNDWGRDCIEQTVLLRSLPRYNQQLRQRLYWADCPAPFAPPVWSTIEAEIVLSRLPCTARSASVVIQRGQRLRQRLYWADCPVPYAPPAWSTSVVNQRGQRLRQRLYWADCPVPYAPPAWPTIEAEIVLSRLPCSVRSAGVVNQRG
jgi:hypothetical protein